MRKDKLRQKVDSFCRNDHSGSHRTRKHRYFVLHKVIRDLFYTGHIPPKWHALTLDDIKHLVLYWQKKGIKPSTIMKYMTIVRDFLEKIEHRIPDISNQQLGLVHLKRKIQIILLPDNLNEKLDSPIAKILIELQIYFGLTLSEAMRLCPSTNIQENALWITREIATNSQDRMIPVRNDIQNRVKQSFLNLCQENNLIVTYGYPCVLNAYKSELKAIQIPSLKSYRYHYARNLYPDLIQVTSPYIAKQTIMREMGISSRRTLWSYLNE
ncbi:TPA: hypothetical protein ACGWTM_002986 [Legionella pneumophila]